ncbi:MAG: hypothetical protein AAF533_09740 [Acidobacteriota bacterium]
MSEHQPPAKTESGPPPLPDSPAPSDGLRRYLLSLPERTVRSAAAVSAGLVKEVADVALPETVRGSNLYRNTVEGTLRFLIESVGGVEPDDASGEELTGKVVAQSVAGQGIEALGFVTFRASPVWITAALADVCGAGRTLISQVADSLKEEGLLEKDVEFETVDGLLDGLEQTSGRVAQAITSPPMDVASLREEWREIKEHARTIPPSELPTAQRLCDQWQELQDEAAAQGRSVFQLSSAMAMSAVESVPDLSWWSRSAAAAARRTGQVFASPLLDHHRTTLAKIREDGFLSFWGRQLGPYLRAAAAQLAPGTDTLTDRLLDRNAEDDPTS